MAKKSEMVVAVQLNERQYAELLGVIDKFQCRKSEALRILIDAGCGKPIDLPELQHQILSNAYQVMINSFAYTYRWVEAEIARVNGDPHELNKIPMLLANTLGMPLTHLDMAAIKVNHDIESRKQNDGVTETK